MAGKTGVSLNWGGLDKAIGNAAKNMANHQALMNSVGEALVSGTIDRFQKEETPEGEKWEPSGRATNEGGQTLSDTGLLKKSIEYAATPDLVMVGTNKPYSLIHQKGGIITPKKGKYLKFKGSNGKDAFVKQVTIPARPYIGVSKADMEEVKSILHDFLAGAFK